MVDFEIDKIVPKFILNDKTGNAMAQAIGKGLEDMCAVIKKGVDLIDDTDTMPAWRCNEVAWEQGAEWYDSTADLDSKREQVKNILDVTRRLGTKKAVTDAISSLFGGGYVQEWTEYGGEPYHYRVYVSDPNAITEKARELHRLLGIISPVRCVCDGIYNTGSYGSVTVYNFSGGAGSYTAMTATTAE